MTEQHHNSSLSDTAEGAQAPGNVSRQGRALQVWDEHGAREVAVAIPVDRTTMKIMLVTSRSSPGQWILPKGGWESDETLEQSAERECWEEAGVVGKVTQKLGVWYQHSKKKPGKIKSRFTVYELAIHECRDHWPEDTIRQRQWFTVEDALRVLKHPWMSEALKASSLGSSTDAGAVLP